MLQFWKILKWFLIAILAFFVLDLSIIIFFSFYRPNIHKTDAIVILGAAINTPSSYNRSLEGLKLYQEGLAPVVVLSGGQDYSGAITEANYMEKAIEANSQAPITFILEDQSHSTYDNIKNTKAELGGNTGSLIIVSDDFHLARAVLTAWRQGFHPVYWDSPQPKYYDTKELFYYYGREIFAMIDYIPKFIKG
jgi:uncharacterized SAM-binding protein YcdF (DUF218 family)